MAYTQQPMPQPAMNAGGNRNAKNLPVGGDGRDWSEGLCGCFGDCGTCVVAWCCPCVTYGKVKRRLEHLETRGTPDPEDGGCCSSDCMIHGLLTCCGVGWIMQMMNRGAVRQRYNIKGGGLMDCCTAFWCTPCELVQESREIELEEQSFGGKH